MVQLSYLKILILLLRFRAYTLIFQDRIREVFQNFKKYLMLMGLRAFKYYLIILPLLSLIKRKQTKRDEKNIKIS